jgi:hypothetical protein
MLWRIYYHEGKTFCDADGGPYEAPRQGAQLIIQPDPEVGRFLLTQKDFFWWEADKQFWFAGDYFGLVQYLLGSGPKMVLFGRFIKWQEYQACLQRALVDPDFPSKSAKHPLEMF